MITPNLSQAVSLLRQGGLVAFPTETVYGLGADARNEVAVQRVFAVKQRPMRHPLIVHLARAEQINDWAQAIPDTAWRLASAFWPGPLTIVLPKQAHVLNLVTGGQDTVALRVPAHPLAQALLQAFGDGVVAPSANLFTHLSPTTAEAVRAELGDEVDLILDGGLCAVGVESTIVDLTDARGAIILRPGMITRAQLVSVLQCEVFSKEEVTTTQIAPGMHALHYAPRTKTLLVAAAELPALVDKLAVDHLSVVVLTQQAEALNVSSGVKFISMPLDAAEYAHTLYDTLRRVDEQHFDLIVVEEVPQTVAWEAIHDRLRKASAGRS